MKTFLIIQLCFVLVPAGCSKKSGPTSIPAPMIPGRVINVSTATQLHAALGDARPGDEIIVADGVYNGKFVVAPGKNGTPVQAIVLTGSRNAILDAGNINTGYVLHIQSSYWQIKGVTIRNGLKGVMADGARNCVFENILVTNIGEEGIHLRKFSSKNIIRNCEITAMGLKTPDFGEGIYVGSAKSNWPVYTNGNPDLCDSNIVLNNIIGPGITAECIDIKEGTTATLISGNSFDATGITGANSGDSWIDVKGNYAIIENNSGYNPGGTIFKDGYQVHVAVAGWGNYNEFKNNTSSVNAAGFGFNIQLSGSSGTSTGNKVYGNNTVSGALSGVANIPVTN